jgi:hypothetical protein
MTFPLITIKGTPLDNALIVKTTLTWRSQLGSLVKIIIAAALLMKGIWMLVMPRSGGWKQSAVPRSDHILEVGRLADNKVQM